MIDLLVHITREMFPLVNFVILIAIIVLSRRWTGVSISARQDMTESDISHLRGSVRKLDLEHSHIARESTEANEHVIRELHALTSAIDTLLGLRDQVVTLEGRMDKAEQHMVSCPYNNEEEA